MFALVDSSRKKLRELKADLLGTIINEMARDLEESVSADEKKCEELRAKWIDKIDEVKERKDSIEIDFEQRENEVREAIWVLEVALMRIGEKCAEQP